jgi:hypothetical protein
MGFLNLVPQVRLLQGAPYLALTLMGLTGQNNAIKVSKNASTFCVKTELYRGGLLFIVIYN